ncbi:MAG TPA: DegT/DnrJ/EryC1/StrS family aminotransferase [Xanthomonadales bacterium]|nr:DegT/DnrJ/EryC1/StrS family aminotransferase [Xanthomonadales bacterium]
MPHGTIPLHDLAAQDASLRGELRAALDRVLASGTYVGGPEGAALERELASALSVEHVVAVNSGTDALVLALRAAGIGPGHEVIVPSYTFIATASAVSLAGAVPVFADSLPDRFTVDPSAVAAAVTPRTAAAIAVHLFGEPAELDALARVCEANGISLIEDVAQAFGARYRGATAGAAGRLAAFSFYPTKNLACAGDGGAVATNDAAFADVVRSLRSHGRGERQTHVRLGVNSRLDEVQAAILRVKLPHVAEWNARRRALAGLYRRGLDGTRAVCPNPPSHAEHVYNQFVIVHPERDALRERLSAAGIATALYYATPCHRQPLYASESSPDLPMAEQWSRTALALPIYPELPGSAVEAICAEIRSFERAVPAAGRSA